MGKGQAGQATLIGLSVLAACAGVVAVQLRSFEQQAIEERFDRRADQTRTYGAMALERIDDLVKAGHLVEVCDAGRSRLILDPALTKAQRQALTKVFDTAGQRARISYCDVSALSDRDREQLYRSNAREPKGCKQLRVEVSFAKSKCGKADGKLVATAKTGDRKRTDARQVAPLLAELTPPKAWAPSAAGAGGSPKKGCPFACHTGNAGKLERRQAEGG